MNVGWKDYETLMMKLALKVYASDFEPDAIVCIGRGGMVLGDAFSRIFEKKLGVIMASSYGGEGEKIQGALKIAEHLSIVQKEIKGNILLLDDLVESGKTLEEMKTTLKNRYPGITNVKTAVIYKKSKTKFIPDFYALDVDQNTWIYQPCERFDRMTVKHLSKEFLQTLSDQQLGELAETMLD